MILDRQAPVEAAPLRLADRPQPAPQSGEVRLRVRCCAVCRTDLHVIEGDLPPARLPLVPGHQIVGVVDALGPGCRRFRIGQRIGVAWLGHACGRCEFCRGGRENLCERPRFTGYHHDGGYAELATVAEDFAYEIPDALDDVSAAPLLCAGIIGYRALRRAEVPAGGRLALFGFGSSAHIVLQIARNRGCGVFVVTRGARRRDLARRMGAEWAGETAADLAVKVDSAILFAPAGELVPAALACLKPGGTLALAGIHMTPTPPLDYQKHLFHERNLRSVTASTRADGRELLAEAAAAGVRPHTATYALADANRALQDMKSGRIEGTGVLVL